MKKFGILISVIASSVLVVAAMSFASGRKAPEDLMFEAAQKRLRLKGLELAGKDASKNVSWEEKALLKKTYIAVFTDLLVQESLQKDPKILNAAKERFLKRAPKLYQIKVDGDDINVDTYVILASAASACSKVPTVFQVSSVETAAKSLCLDPVLDDVSFAVLGATLHIEVLPLTAIESYPNAGAHYDHLVERELKALVIENFLTFYAKTGNVSLL